MQSIHIPEDALCHKSVTRQPNHASLWEGLRFRESEVAMASRHRFARAYCAQCPLLDTCEQMLTSYEEKGIAVEGVVAGRYTVLRSQDKTFVRQEKCKICQIKLMPPNGRRTRLMPGERHHAGEGLCEQCYPVMSRRARLPSRGVVIA